MLKHILVCLGIIFASITQLLPAQSDDIHRKAAQGRYFAVKRMLARGVSADLVDDKGNTPLHYARTSKVARVLLNYGAEVNAPNCDGATPMHLAGMTGRTKVISTLVARGGDVNAKNLYGITPLHVAVGYMRLTPADIGVLATQGIITGAIGAMALSKNTTRLQIDPAESFMRLTVLEGYYGPEAALASAAYTARVTQSKIVAVLIIGAASIAGTTYFISEGIHRFRAVNALIKNGADLSAQDKLGNTPLHILAAGRPFRLKRRLNAPLLARLLIRRGADASITNNEGNTPYDVARKFNRYGLRYLLPKKKKRVRNESI